MATTFPERIQTFKVYEDINENDASLVTQYQNAMERGDIAYANYILEQINHYSNKILTALDLNTIVDTCQALEQYYLEAYSPAYIVSEIQPEAQQVGDYWFEIVKRSPL